MLCRPERGRDPHVITAAGPLRASEHFLQSWTPHSPAEARVTPRWPFPVPLGMFSTTGAVGRAGWERNTRVYIGCLETPSSIPAALPLGSSSS